MANGNEMDLDLFQEFIDNRRVKINEMELLMRVAETRSMTKAAKQLHLTPAAVSAAVARVETALGVRLFERTTRSIRLTPEGQVVLDGCHDVVEHWQRTLEQVRGSTRELVGVVHLSAPADTTYQVLAPVLASASEAHPGLEVVVHSSDELHHLHREAIDMAIRYGRLRDSSLTARKLAECPALLVAAPAYLERFGAPIEPSDLREHRCITLQLSGTPTTSWALFGDDRVDVRLAASLCGDGYLARQWAISGMGIARKSLFDVIDDLEAGRLVRVLPNYDAGSAPIHVIFPSRRHVPARVRALDSLLEAAFHRRSTRCAAWLRAS